MHMKCSLRLSAGGLALPSSAVSAAALMQAAAAAAQPRVGRSTLLIVLFAILLSCSLIHAHGSLLSSAPEGCPTPASTTANTAGIRHSEVSIDAVTVLLPAHVHTAARTFVVYYPVQAHGGCFTWRTSHPGLINIQPIDKTRCSERVAQRNPATGEHEWVTKEGYTSVYVSAATTIMPGGDDQAGVGAPVADAPIMSNSAFQRRQAAWISAHDITREDKIAEWSVAKPRTTHHTLRIVHALPPPFSFSFSAIT